MAAIALAALFVPPSDPVAISFVYSNDAADLLEPIIREFNDSQGEVKVVFGEAPSGRVWEQIRDGERKPVMWMPAASTWPRLLNDSVGRAIAPTDGPSFFWSPEVIGTFESTLDDEPVGGWDDLVRLAAERRRIDGVPFRIGHTKPTSSTSGLYALLSEFDAVDEGKPDAHAGTIEAVRDVESAVLHYGDIADDFCDLIKRYGNTYVQAFYMQETTFLQCEAAGLQEVIPTQTYVADYPMIIFDAAWVSQEEAAAAERFVEYLERNLTEQAVLDEKFRFGDPWEGGIAEDPAPIPDPGDWRALDVPPVEVLIDVQAAWPLIRKPADVLILFERGGEMNVEGRFERAKALLAGDLLVRLDPTVRVGLTTFTDTPEHRVPLDRLSGPHIERLLEELDGLGATTATSDPCGALADALELVADPEHISVILLLTMGTQGETPCRPVVAALRGLLNRVSPVQVYAISFGDELRGDALLIEEIANASLGWCASFYPADDHSPCQDLTAEQLVDDLTRIL